jgi:hypothetical protein
MDIFHLPQSKRSKWTPEQYREICKELARRMIAHSQLSDAEQQQTPQSGSLASWREWFTTAEVFSGSDAKTGIDCFWQANRLKARMAQQLGVEVVTMSRAACGANAGAVGGAVTKRKWDAYKEAKTELKLDPTNQSLLE